MKNPEVRGSNSQISSGQDASVGGSRIIQTHIPVEVDEWATMTKVWSEVDGRRPGGGQMEGRADEVKQAQTDWPKTGFVEQLSPRSTFRQTKGRAHFKSDSQPMQQTVGEDSRGKKGSLWPQEGSELISSSAGVSVPRGTNTWRQHEDTYVSTDTQDNPNV